MPRKKSLSNLPPSIENIDIEAAMKKAHSISNPVQPQEVKEAVSFKDTPEYKKAAEGFGILPSFEKKAESFSEKVNAVKESAVETIEEKRARWRKLREDLGDISTLEKAQQALGKISGDMTYPKKIKVELRETIDSFLRIKAQEEKSKKRIAIEAVIKILRTLKKCYCETWIEAGREASKKITDQLSGYTDLNLREQFPEIEAIIYKYILDTINSNISPEAEKKCNELIQGVE